MLYDITVTGCGLRAAVAVGTPTLIDNARAAAAPVIAARIK
jgi:hypothetical protein